MAILKDFSGGLNNALDPDKISPSQATQLLNAENFGKGLRSKKKCTYTVFNEDTGPDYIDEGTDPYNSEHSRYFYEFTDKDGTDRLVRFRYNPYIVREDNGSNLDRIYSCDGISPPQEIKFYGNTGNVPATQADTNKRRLGIVRPTFEGNTVSQGKTVLTFTENFNFATVLPINYENNYYTKGTLDNNIVRTTSRNLLETSSRINRDWISITGSKNYSGQGDIPTAGISLHNKWGYILWIIESRVTNGTRYYFSKQRKILGVLSGGLASGSIENNSIYSNANPVHLTLEYMIRSNAEYSIYVQSVDSSNNTKFYTLAENINKNFTVTNRVRSGNLRNIGIHRDTFPSNTDYLPSIDQTAFNALSPGNAIASNSLRKKYQFFLSYYNENDDIESRQSDISEVFNFINSLNYTVNNLPISPDPQVTHKKVYVIDYETGVTRLFGTASKLDKSINGIPGGTVDEVFDAQNNEPPPIDIKYFTQFNGRLFGAKGNELRWSQTGKYDYWNPLNSVNFNKPITGLLPTSRGLLVFTANETYAFFGNDITNFQKILLSNNIGCTNHRTCQLIKSIPIWWSEEGLTTFTGGQIKVISRDILADKVDIIDSTVLNDKYYALRAYGYDNNGNFESEVLEFDMRRTLSLSKYQIRQNANNLDRLRNVDTIYNHNNQIKCSASNYRHPVGNLQVIVGILITLDNHTNDAEFTYESPVLTEGSFSTLKQIDHINLKVDGSFAVTVTMYLNDREITLNQTITSSKFHRFDINVDYQNYLGFKLKVVGTGKLEEFSFDPVLNYQAQRRLP